MSVTHTITGGLEHLSGNPVQIILTASAPRTNHKLAIKVKCSELLSPVQVEEIEPVNLVSTFNIQGLVDEPSVLNLTYPAVGNSNPYDMLARLISLEIGEVWDDASGVRTEEWTVIEDVLKVLDGKLRQHELALLNKAGKSFASEYIHGGKFLTHQPITTIVSPDQQPRLWYLNRFEDNHPIDLNLKVTTNLKIINITDPKIMWDITRLLEMVINPYFWSGGLWENPLDPGEYVVSYEFWITDAEGDVSEHRYFIVDRKYYEKNYYLLYRNKFSVTEIAWLHGEAKQVLKTESETAYTPVAVGAGTMESSLTTISSTDQRSWIINTGYKSLGERLALRDLLGAKDRWLIDPDDSSVLIPVYIESGDFLLHNTMDEMPEAMGIEITMYESHLD